MKIFQKLLALFITFLVAGCSLAPVNVAAFKNTVVTLTFDDGDADNYKVREILKANNLRATFYIVSGFTGTPDYMTADELRGLYADGNEIGGHTINHTNLLKVRGADLKREVCQNRLDLLAYGFEVRSFAYPYGQYDQVSSQTVMDCGYNNARVVTGGPAAIPPSNAYTIPAMPYIVKGTRTAKMIGYVNGVESGGGGWAIFTFHHVCDGCDQYSIPLKNFTEFAQWLNKQQKSGLVIKTMGEVVGGDVKPGVTP